MPNRRISEVIGQRNFPCITSNTSVRDAAILMKECQSSAVLVVENGVLMGICTGRDIVFRVVALDCDPGLIPVGTIMSCDTQTIEPDRPFGHALHLMYESGFRHLPVVDPDGHPIGLLTAHDALDADGLQMEDELVRREEITVIL